MLDHVVVETAAGGQKCIEFLREKKLGRANFVVLDQVKAPKPAGATPDGAPRLFDLVTPSHPKYAGAFYMALRDTLVAEDLDEAVKLAYRPDNSRWRVVTTDGKLIDTSGTMSGGGGKAKSGKITLTGGTGGVSRSAAAATGDEDALRQLKRLAELVVPTPRPSSRRRRHARSPSRELRAAAEVSASTKQAAAKLEKALASKRKAADAAQAAFDAADADAAELRAAVLDAGGQALKDAVAKAEITRALADDAANEVEAIGVAVKAAAKAGAKAATRRAGAAGLRAKLEAAEDEVAALAEAQGALDAAKDEALAACDAAAGAAEAAAPRRSPRASAAGAAGGRRGPAALPVEADEALAELDKEEVKYAIALLEEERDGMKATVNLKTIAEYRAKQAEYFARLDELEQVTAARNAAREALEALRTKRLDEFMAGFGAITLKLKEMYQMITLGGDAELELVDSLDPFSEGIVFSVRPPKKSWKNIANLSGGEKRSSLALVRAPPLQAHALYVMDEIDAALDYKNVSIIANYIKDRCRSAQFVIISLRNNMFELADRLTGVYKTHNVTKTITISPDAAATLAQARAPAAPAPLATRRPRREGGAPPSTRYKHTHGSSLMFGGSAVGGALSKSGSSVTSSAVADAASARSASALAVPGVDGPLDEFGML
ncbi:hypothetical protein JL720_11259 [Aureococcus anophagefferens]|nr:hypothetical protein JL720_11259 [Aureococcus anophagefferens]